MNLHMDWEILYFCDTPSFVGFDDEEVDGYETCSVFGGKECLVYSVAKLGAAAGGGEGIGGGLTY